MTELLKEATLSAKGQIVIPAEMRAALHLAPGDKLILIQQGKWGDLIVKTKNPHSVLKPMQNDTFLTKIQVNKKVRITQWS